MEKEIQTEHRQLLDAYRTGNDGVLYTTKTTKVTGKGQIYFINKFLQNKNNEAH